MPEPGGELPKIAMPKVKIGVGSSSVPKISSPTEAASTALIPQLRTEKPAMLPDLGRPVIEQARPLGGRENKAAPMQRKLFPPRTGEQREVAQRVTTARTELTSMQATQQAGESFSGQGNGSERNSRQKGNQEKSQTEQKAEGKAQEPELETEQLFVGGERRRRRTSYHSSEKLYLSRYNASNANTRGKYKDYTFSPSWTPNGLGIRSRDIWQAVK